MGWYGENKLCYCKCQSLGALQFEPPDCERAIIDLKKKNVAKKNEFVSGTDYFPMARSNYWFYNTLDSMGNVNGQYEMKISSRIETGDTTLYTTLLYIPDSTGVQIDTFPGQRFFEVESIENDIYLVENDSMDRLFLYHEYTIGDTLILNEDTTYVLDFGTVAVPAGTFENCIALMSSDSTAIILAPEVGIIQYLAEGIQVTELKETELFCSFRINIGVQDETCPGAADGMFILEVDGDTSSNKSFDGLTLEWAGPTEIPDGNNPVNLSAGYYFVTISNNDCEAIIDSLPITSPTPIEITLENIIHVSCPGVTDGAIDISLSGGTGPLMFSWNDGVYNDEDLTGLAAGCYIIEVMDSLGCAQELTIDILEPEPISLDINGTDISCFGENDGSVHASVSGGTPGYQYLWSNGSSNPSLSNLGSGMYALTVTDSHGCTKSITYEISEPTQLQLTASADSHVSCQGGTDGGASVMVSGGTDPYTYSWVTGSVTSSVVDLTAGTYTLTVTDANGCTMAAEVDVSEPDALTLTAGVEQNVSCFGGTDGGAHVAVTGGSGPYTYLWDMGSETSTVQDLSAGTYTVTVTDANGCVEVADVGVSEPEELVLTTGVDQDVSCKGGADGAASVVASGGTDPYVYMWETGSETSTVQDLSAGTYTVTVTDTNGCTKAATVDVTEPDALVLTAGVEQDVSCQGGTDGGASVEVTGGTGPYTYLWDTGSVTSTVQDLSAGTYTVTVTDVNGCTGATTVNVSEPSAISIEIIDILTVRCHGESNGSITIEAEGGNGTFTFLWNTGETTPMISGLIAGPYSITVSDGNGCTSEQEAIMSEPEVLDVTIINKSDASCFGASDGSIEVSQSGGTAPYTLVWNTGDVSHVINDLPAGDYEVTVTDANGCSAILPVGIAEPEMLMLTFSATPSQSNMADGTASVEVSGGVMPYTFLWDDPNGQNTSEITGLAPGMYSVTVTDANGCTTEGYVTVEMSTATEDIDQSGLHIYPVPTTGKIYMSYDHFPAMTIHVVIYDLRGSQVQTRSISRTDKEILTLDIDDLRAGIYILSLNAENQRWIRQIVKL